MVSEKQIEAAAKAIYANAKNTDARDIARIALTAAEQAEPAAEAVAWVAADTLNSPHPGCVSSLAYMSQIDKDTGREYVPLYTLPTPSEARLREALERVPDEAGHWAYVYCRVHIGSEHEDEISEFVTQKVRSFVERALAEEKRP